MALSGGVHKRGLLAEIMVSKALQKLGWKTMISPGSRGPADIQATKGGKKWCIQVKVRKNPSKIPLRPSEESNLFAHAKIVGGIPVVALVSEIPGGLLMVDTNIRDFKISSLIRDVHGNLVAIELENNWTLFLFNLKDGRKIEP